MVSEYITLGFILINIEIFGFFDLASFNICLISFPLMILLSTEIFPFANREIDSMFLLLTIVGLALLSGNVKCRPSLNIKTEEIIKKMISKKAMSDIDAIDVSAETDILLLIFMGVFCN